MSTHRFLSDAFPRFYGFRFSAYLAYPGYLRRGGFYLREAFFETICRMRRLWRRKEAALFAKISYYTRIGQKSGVFASFPCHND